MKLLDMLQSVKQKKQIELIDDFEEWKRKHLLEMENCNSLRERATQLRKQGLWLEFVLIEVASIEYWMSIILHEHNNLSDIALMGTGYQRGKSVIDSSQVFIGTLITMLDKVVANKLLIESLRQLNRFRNDIAHNLYRRSIADTEKKVSLWFSKNDTLKIHRQLSKELGHIVEVQRLLLTQKDSEKKNVLNEVMKKILETGRECTDAEIHNCAVYIAGNAKPFLDHVYIEQLIMDAERKLENGFFKQE